MRRRAELEKSRVERRPIDRQSTRRMRDVSSRSRQSQGNNQRSSATKAVQTQIVSE